MARRPGKPWREHVSRTSAWSTGSEPQRLRLRLFCAPAPGMCGRIAAGPRREIDKSLKTSYNFNAIETAFASEDKGQ